LIQRRGLPLHEQLGSEVQKGDAMTQFEYVSVATALLYSIGVGRLLSGLPQIARRGASREAVGPHGPLGRISQGEAEGESPAPPVE
jgi:hypothetical protein